MWMGWKAWKQRKVEKNTQEIELCGERGTKMPIIINKLTKELLDDGCYFLIIKLLQTISGVDVTVYTITGMRS